jgi:hypothetical protein
MQNDQSALKKYVLRPDVIIKLYAFVKTMLKICLCMNVYKNKMNKIKNTSNLKTSNHKSQLRRNHNLLMMAFLSYNQMPLFKPL